MTLEKLGLVAKNPDGYYEHTDAMISTGDEWKSLAIQNFQIEAADLAKHAIQNIPKLDRDISTLTLSISVSQRRTVYLQNFRIERYLSHTSTGGIHATARHRGPPVILSHIITGTKPRHICPACPLLPETRYRPLDLLLLEKAAWA
jgi:hypothetical protein